MSTEITRRKALRFLAGAGAGAAGLFGLRPSRTEATDLIGPDAGREFPLDARPPAAAFKLST